MDIAPQTGAWVPRDAAILVAKDADPRSMGVHARSRGKIMPRAHPLVWADKVGLVAALAIAASAAWVCAVTFLTVGTMTYNRLDMAMASSTLAIELAIAVPIWLFMRAIDFAMRGPARRQANRTFRNA